jgi:hypothetical protein
MEKTMLYPNKHMKANELEIGDVVSLYDGPFGTAIVSNKDEDNVTFFRPYGTCADFIYAQGAICYTGTETFTRPITDQGNFYVWQRNNKLHGER